ncbi:methyltransferase [Shewanella glacialipiscicola]|uniref:methyltransferase n=1 Tax=Shewanella glacialipiscicola TaxID=614069 RepID=UPI001C804E19|nr:methyltransferase [Shewanella glacialipiscicola]MCL1085770.1 methyltransferase [Shewanella glacialipiscicola]
MLTNPSQVIIRNQDSLNQHKVLVLNHEADLLPKALLDIAASVDALALDYHHHLHLAPHANSKLRCYFGHELPQQDPLTPEKYDTVIVYFPKAKPLAPYLFNLAANHLLPNGQLLVVGENKGGIKSLVKLLPEYFTTGMKLDNARHCLLFGSNLEGSAPAMKLSDWVSQYQLTTPQGEINICNLVGVFSEKRLDLGTELLLSHLPTLSGRVLDFGCGAGVITAALLKAQPSLALECIDINAMALASCELTLAANGMTAKVYPSDGLAQTTGKFNGIISNPPFHDGLASTTSIAQNFVSDSAKQLQHNGIWQIVANRHLPYSDIIAAEFGQLKVVADNNKYKLYYFQQK